MNKPLQPFGHSIQAADVLDDLSFFDSWEERYKFIIDLGKQLVEMPAELKTEERLVRGCQSQVWLEPVFDGERLHFWVDSDAFIVKGLLAVVMSAYNNQKPADISHFDIEGYFAQIDLLRHLSPTRGNGLRSVVKRIQDFAASV
jgi:cysteine desulfuration protein SufE